MITIMSKTSVLPTGEPKIVRRPSGIALPQPVSDTLGLYVMESYGMWGGWPSAAKTT
jgi:hypothetical protein